MLGGSSDLPDERNAALVQNPRAQRKKRDASIENNKPQAKKKKDSGKDMHLGTPLRRQGYCCRRVLSLSLAHSLVWTFPRLRGNIQTKMKVAFVCTRLSAYKSQIKTLASAGGSHGAPRYHRSLARPPPPILGCCARNAGRAHCIRHRRHQGTVLGVPQHIRVERELATRRPQGLR